MMELSWSDDEVSLSSFVESFTLPQIVQVGDGLYGETDETTLSRGQELNLHVLKDAKFFSGVTETGAELHIPLNSPHKVRIFAEKKLEKYDSLKELAAVFPQKYKYVRLQSKKENSSKNTETIEGEEPLRALYFDKDAKNLVCVDKYGCELTLKMERLGTINVIEKTDESVFMAEVFHRFSLPLIVQFIPQSKSSVNLARGLIYLKKVIVKQTVVATSRDEGCSSILTFPSNLDVTVIPPQASTLVHPEYRKLCENLNMKVNLKKVVETIENDEELYDDVLSCVVKVIPYAEAFFGKRTAYDTLESADDDLDEDNYVVVDRKLPTRPVEATRRNSGSTISPATGSGTGQATPSGTCVQKKPGNIIQSLTRKISGSGTAFWDKVSRSSTSSTSSLTSPTSPVADVFPQPDEENVSDEDSDGDVYEMPTVSRPNVSDKTETRIKFIEKKKKIEDFTIKEVGILLGDLNLSQYEEAFAREQVDGKILRDLDKEMLQSHFKMTPFHAHKLNKAASENWRPTVRDQQ